MKNKNAFDKSKLGAFKFSKQNYTLLFIGLAINILGFILMIGGGSDDHAIFKETELFSARRITLAPILVMLGYGVIGYAIMKNPFKEKK
ncbi:MAG TPA: DUF3098 domain-containing protein [Crocinitomicaceae bacterium]|jgi:hypothetical protein|nr:DUF3098 domain-containing protein [Crocinitomicaceae bacterium]